MSANQTGHSPARMAANRVTAILRDDRAVSVETALRLDRYFGTASEFWVNLQGPGTMSPWSSPSAASGSYWKCRHRWPSAVRPAEAASDPNRSARTNHRAACPSCTVGPVLLRAAGRSRDCLSDLPWCKRNRSTLEVAARRGPLPTKCRHLPYIGRTMQVDQNRRRSQRIEVRATPEDRALIDRAVATAGTNVTAFVLSSVTTAARQVLADRTEFVLSPEAADAWDAINERPARDLPGLRELMQRQSPFIRE